MNKADLIARVAEESGVTKKLAAEVVENTFVAIKESLAAGEKFTLVGFGTFEVVERAEREGRNPQTGEPITIPARKAVRFKAGKALKEVVQ